MIIRDSALSKKQMVNYRVSIDGANLEKAKGAISTDVTVDPGTYDVRLSSAGYRTNSIAVQVREGGRHYVRISPTTYMTLLRVPLLGILPLLVAMLWPGLAFRIQNAQI